MSFHVSFPGLGIENLEISRRAFSFFGLFDVYWYGIIIALAVLLTLSLSTRQAKHFGLSQDDVLDTFLWMLPIGFLCARLYYVAFSWEQYAGHFWSIFDTRRGGLAFYGGVIGGVLTFLVMCRKKKRRLANWLDFFVVYLPLGQAIGRWGNFFNQEAFGTNTTLPWGMISEGTRDYLSHLLQSGADLTRVGEIDPMAPVHPTFFYEFLGNLLIFALLLYVRKRTKYDYETLSWYLLLYGALRFFVESIRTDALYIGSSPLRVSMLLSLVMFLAGLGYLLLVQLNKLPDGLHKMWESPVASETAAPELEQAATEEEKQEHEHEPEEETQEK